MRLRPRARGLPISSLISRSCPDPKKHTSLGMGCRGFTTGSPRASEHADSVLVGATLAPRCGLRSDLLVGFWPKGRACSPDYRRAAVAFALGGAAVGAARVDAGVGGVLLRLGVRLEDVHLGAERAVHGLGGSRSPGREHDTILLLQTIPLYPIRRSQIRVPGPRVFAARALAWASQ